MSTKNITKWSLILSLVVIYAVGFGFGTARYDRIHENDIREVQVYCDETKTGPDAFVSTIAGMFWFVYLPISGGVDLEASSVEDES